MRKAVRVVSIILIMAILAGLSAMTVSGATAGYVPLENVRIAGNFDELYAPGVTLTLEYDEVKKISISLSDIVWYESSEKNDGYVAIPDENDISFKLTEANDGKYIKAGITPVSDDGKKTGEEVLTSAVYVEPALDRPYEIWNNAMATVGWQSVANNFITDDGFEMSNSSRFFLLDASEDGSDFLIMDDYWGKANGSIGTTRKRTKDMDPSKPENELAYWLNNGYLQSPNYDAKNEDANNPVCQTWYGLPKSMVEHLNRDAIWRTEASRIKGVTDEYVFRAAVTLPSFNEIIKYGKKLKRVPASIYHTRTVYNETGMYSVGDYNQGTTTHLIGSTVKPEALGQIRAIFRLKRSFFTSTRISPSKMGKNVKAMLVRYFSRSELRNVYSDDELTEIGFPKITVFADTLKYEDGKINGSFTFENLTDAEKDMAIILAVIEDGTNRVIDCNITPVKVAQGANSYSINEFETEVSDDRFIKAMVWDSVEGMIPYGKTELSEDITIKWRDTEAVIGNYLPGDVELTISVDSKHSTSNPYYGVYISVNGGEKKFWGNVKAIPGETVSREVALGDIANGKSNVTIEIYKDNRVVASDSRDIVVMEGYSKQFMDEFTVSAINYNYSNNHTIFKGANNDYDKFKYAGFNTERGGLLWQLFEKQKGVYDFSWVSYSQWMKALRGDGISSNVILGGGNPFLYPMWEEHLGMDLSTLDPSIQAIRNRYAPHTQEGIYAYINAYLTYEELFGNNNITYEIWNEPDIDTFWQPQPHQQDYANLVKATAASMKFANYERPIAALSIASDSLDNPIEYFELGIYPYMNKMSYHNYWVRMNVDDDRFFENKFDRYHNIIVEAGGWKKQSLTENGWPTGSNKSSVSEEVAAENAVKMFTVADSKNSEYFLFGFKNFGRNSEEIEHNWGIIDADGNPKLAYIALTNRNIHLRGGVFVGELDLGDSEIRAFVYLKENKPVVQIWDGSKDRDTLDYTFDGEYLSVSDFYGTKISDDTDTVTLTKYPSYIEGLSHKYISMAAHADLIKDKELYISKYKDVLPSKHVTAIDDVFDNAISVLTNPAADKLEDAVNRFNEIGVGIIESAEKGAIDEIVASRATFELTEAISTLCVVYMSEYEGEAIYEPLYSADEAKEKAEALYRNDNRIMPYSDAILTYATDTDKKVKALIESDYDPESIKGYVAGWSLETKVYCDWFNAFSKFEDILNYGYLTQVMPSGREAEEGKTINIKINANNISKVAFTGTIKLYDEDGKELASSESFSLGEKEYKYIELPFKADKRNNSSERHLTVSYVASNGEILTENPLIVTIK